MQNNTSYSTVVLSALLIGIFLPLVCGLTAYAAQLEVSSPYFNFRIGPPLVDSGSASASLNPNEGTDGNSDAVSPSLGTCLLNVVCINPIVKDDSSAPGEGLDLDADVSVEAAGEDGIDLGVDVAADAGIEIGVGPGEEDGLDLDLDLHDSGAEVDLDVGDDVGLDLDLDLDDGLDLDLDLGLP